MSRNLNFRLEPKVPVVSKLEKFACRHSHVSYYEIPKGFHFVIKIVHGFIHVKNPISLLNACQAPKRFNREIILQLHGLGS